MMRSWLAGALWPCLLSAALGCAGAPDEAALSAPAAAGARRLSRVEYDT